jgi:NAD(P)H-dependent FMN reductase
MQQAPLQVAVVIGSTREGRFGPIVAQWFVGQAEHRSDISVDLVDLADVPVTEGVFARRIERADAVVLVTPEYNHSFPGPLKTAIDSALAEWRAKPVAFVSYGGISGGLRAVQQLRNIFPELRAMTVRETVSFHHAWFQFDEKGDPVDPDNVNRAAAALLEELTWWGHTLRQARNDRPFAA